MRKLTVLLFLFLFFNSVIMSKAYANPVEDRENLVQAWIMYNQNNFIQAKKIFTTLKNSNDPEITMEASMGLGYVLIKLKNYKGARSVFLHLVKNKYKTKKTIPALMDIFVELKEFEAIEPLLPKLNSNLQFRLKLIIYHHKLKTLKDGSDKRFDVAILLLKLDKNDKFALNVAAWHLYKKKDYIRAKKLFKNLIMQSPTDSGSILGLGYCLLSLNSYYEAYDTIAKPKLENTTKIIQLKKLLYPQIIEIAIKDEKWLIAEDLLNKILLFDSGNIVNIIKLAKVYNNIGKNELAIKVLNKEFDWKKSPSNASSLLKAYVEVGLDSKAWDLAELFSKSDELKDIATSYYAHHNYFVTASQVKNTSAQTYTNASSTRIEGFIYHRYHSGDHGKSRLNETVLPASLTFSGSQSRQWSVSLISRQLNSGNPTNKAGNYYSYINGDQSLSNLENKATVHNFSVCLEKEGPFSYAAMLGTSPIGADVSVTPVFLIKSKVSNWFFEIHRESVDDSILSYTGLKDPYGKDAWGRVLKTGVTIEKAFVFENWWISTTSRINHYDGENVWENTSWQIDLSMGKTVSLKEDWEMTYGVFATFMQFDNNSNYFTYGHGGYYSPEYMIVSGPLFRLKTKSHHKHWMDLRISLGWMEEKTGDSSYYPIQDTPDTTLSSTAMDEFNSVYQGEKSSGLALSMKWEGWKMITGKISTGAFLSINQSSGYSELKVGIGIEYTFGTWSSFWKTENIENRFCSK